MNNEDTLKFKKLFGIEAQSLGKNLIISPFLSPKIFKPELKKPEFFRGILFKGLNGIYKNKRISFITTGIGHTLVNDCILAVSSCEVESAVFLGAIGAIDNLNFADCVLIEEACFDGAYYERFGIGKMGNLPEVVFTPHAQLVNLCDTLAKKQKMNLTKTRVMSLNSLWEEDENLILELRKKNVKAIELECALFYAAARNKKIPALALCFVSDLLFTRPFWLDTSLREKAKISNSIAQLRRLALEVSVSL